MAHPATVQPGRPAAGHGARVAWAAVGVVLALVAIGIWVGVQVRSEFRNSYAAIAPRHRTYPDTVHKLVIKVATGTVSVQRSAGGATAVVSTGTRSSRTPTDDEHLVGSTLYVTSSCGGPTTSFVPYCSRDYRIRVPASASVVATVATGNVVLDGVHGGIRATVGSGSVSVSNAAGTVAVTTQSGDVVVRKEGGSLKAFSGTGNVLLANARGPVTAQSQNGDVFVAGASTTVHVTTGTGSVEATRLTGSTFLATLTNGNAEVSFTISPHEVDVTTGTGSVGVHVPSSDVKYQLHLTTQTGRVIPGIGNDPSSTRVIRVLTSNGDIDVGVGVVVPPAPTAPTPPGG